MSGIALPAVAATPRSAAGMPAVLMALVLSLLLFAPRLAPSGTLNHVFAYDAATLLFLPYVLLRWRELHQITGSAIALLAGAFLVYSLMITANLAVLQGYPLWVGLAFWGKEAQVLAVLAFFALLARRHPRAAVAAVPLAASILVAVVLWQVGYGRFTGFYGFVGLPGDAGPSQSGAVFGLLLVFTLAMAVQWHALPPLPLLRSRAILIALAVVFGMALLLTISRSGIVSTSVAIIALAVLFIGQRSPARARRVVLGGIALVAAVGIAAWLVRRFVPDSLVILARRFDEIRGGTAVGGYGLGRLVKIEMLLAYLAERPLAAITGFGLGSPNYVIPAFSHHDLGLRLVVDNQYVRRLFEVGLAGTVLWTSTWIFLLTRIWRRSAGAFGYFLFSAGAAALTLMLVMSSTHEVFQVSRVAAVFHALFGLVLGATMSGLNVPARYGSRE